MKKSDLYLLHVYERPAFSLNLQSTVELGRKLDVEKDCQFESQVWSENVARECGPWVWLVGTPKAHTL